MQNDKLNFLVSMFAVTATILGLGASAYAVPGDLEIKVDKNADLVREPTLTNLTTEARFSEDKEKHADQVTIGASFLNLGHPQIGTDQTSTYNMRGGAAAAMEYTHSFGTWHMTGTMGYSYLQQTSAPAATALHVIPIGVVGEYYYKKFEKIRPFVGAGVMGIVQSQRGIDAENVTDFNTLPVVTAGIDYKTPWDVRIHTRVRELMPMAQSANQFRGELFDIGFGYAL